MALDRAPRGLTRRCRRRFHFFVAPRSALGAFVCSAHGAPACSLLSERILSEMKQQQQQQQQQVEQLGIAKPAAAPVQALRRCISSNRNGNKAHKQRRKREHEHITRRAAPAASCFFESVPLGAGLQQKNCSAAAQQLEFPAWKTARRAAIFAGSKAVAAVVPIKTQPCDGLKPEQKNGRNQGVWGRFRQKSAEWPGFCPI